MDQNEAEAFVVTFTTLKKGEGSKSTIVDVFGITCVILI